MRRRLRDSRDPVEQRYPAAKDTALYAGALAEIKRMDAENARLRRLLDEHGIKDPGAGRS